MLLWLGFFGGMAGKAVPKPMPGGPRAPFMHGLIPLMLKIIHVVASHYTGFIDTIAAFRLGYNRLGSIRSRLG